MANHSEENPTSRPTLDCLHFQMTWTNLEVDPSERIDGVWSNLFEQGTEVACEGVIKEGASDLWKSSIPNSENPFEEEQAISLGSTTCINDHLNSSALSSEMLNASFNKSDNFSQEPDKYQVFSPTSPNRPLRFEDETEKFEFNMKVDCDKIACTDIFPSSPRSE